MHVSNLTGPTDMTDAIQYEIDTGDHARFDARLRRNGGI